MYQLTIWNFQIKNNKILTGDEHELPIQLEDQITIAKELLETWWNSRTLVNNGVIFEMTGTTSAENERVVNRSLGTNKDARLLDINDHTVVIPIGELVDFAEKLDFERDRTMQLWDDLLSHIKSGDDVRVLTAIKDLIELLDW